eukprot:scaffold86736_cov37-Attheya_sp.AAC.2
MVTHEVHPSKDRNQYIAPIVATYRIPLLPLYEKSTSHGESSISCRPFFDLKSSPPIVIRSFASGRWHQIDSILQEQDVVDLTTASHTTHTTTTSCVR